MTRQEMISRFEEMDGIGSKLTVLFLRFLEQIDKETSK